MTFPKGHRASTAQPTGPAHSATAVATTKSPVPRMAAAVVPTVDVARLLRQGLLQASAQLPPPALPGAAKEWPAVPVATSAGTTTSKRLGLRVDLGQLRGQQLAVEASRRAAQSGNFGRSTLLADVTHEIRTPMTGMISMAEMLCDSGLSQEQRQFAETIRSSGEALLTIINDILDYSKGEATRQNLHPEAFDLEKLIHDVTLLMLPQAQAKGVEMMIDFDASLTSDYIGDAGRLRQVLTNLIGNAVKFTDHGHVLTRVTGIERDDGRQQLHITVEDSGIGIPVAQLDQIFGEFEQAHDTNRNRQGSGLGLSITRRLMERMGGAVWVDSELGKGSAFGLRVSLPRASTALPPQPPSQLSHVMVVDERFINRTILERQLSAFGIGVTLCRSAAAALEAMQRGQRPDLVLTAHQMPMMDGLDLAQALRALGHNLPILLLSATPAAARQLPATAAVTAVVQKPALRRELFAQLEQALETQPNNVTQPEACAAGLAASAAALPGPEIPEEEPPVAVTAALEQAPPPPDAIAAPALPPANLTPPADKRQMRVLAAEDNKTNQLVLQKMVRGFDIELQIVENGRQALELWQSYAPDLIFMDIAMPEMNGKEAARAIRALEASGTSRTPIVALSAHSHDAAIEAVLAAGADAFQSKPLRRSEILALLCRYAPAAVRDVVATGPVPLVQSIRTRLSQPPVLARSFLR